MDDINVSFDNDEKKINLDGDTGENHLLILKKMIMQC